MTSSQVLPILPSRQKVLLALLQAIGGRAGNLDYQKLLFLYCAQAGEAPTYEFVPYKLGAFSFTSYADRRKLVDRGLIEDIENAWQITSEGRKAVGADSRIYDSFARQVKGLRGDELVAETYRRFPYLPISSRGPSPVLPSDPPTLRPT